MKEHNYKFKKGDLIAFSGGEYSDYVVQGFFKAKESLDIEDLLGTWRVYEEPKVRSMSFTGWLNKLGLIEEVQYREIWTGSYGDTYLEEY